MKFYQKIPRRGVICNYGVTENFKTSYLSIDFVMPLTAANATGMSLLAGVFSRGCAKYPQMDLISRYLARCYGASFSINAAKAGELEILTFSFTHLDNQYAIDGEDIRGAVIELFYEMLFRPLVKEGAFDPEYVAQEKNNLADRMAGLFNDKRIYALEKCKAIMCAEEAYGINDMGDQETLKNFDAENLYAFFCKILKEAYIVISYVGKDCGSVLDKIADEFAARSGEMPATAVVSASGRVKEIVETMELSQSKLNLGFRLGDAAREKSSACRLFNVLYGGSASSKLFMNVRERLSLCYYCSSNIDRFKNVMFVSSGIEAEKYEEARREIEAQLAAVAAGDFSDEEFENARIHLIDGIRGISDNKSALASFILSGTLRGGWKTLDQEIEEIQAVKKEDVMQIAAETVLDTVYFLKGVHSEK